MFEGGTIRHLDIRNKAPSQLTYSTSKQTISDCTGCRGLKLNDKVRKKVYNLSENYSDLLITLQSLTQTTTQSHRIRSLWFCIVASFDGKGAYDRCFVEEEQRRTVSVEIRFVSRAESFAYLYRRRGGFLQTGCVLWVVRILAERCDRISLSYISCIKRISLKWGVCIPSIVRECCIIFTVGQWDIS